MKARFEDLKARREVDLDARRARLAHKLVHEEAALRQELLDSKERPEERRAKLADRARLLATKRESERQQLATSLLDRAFDEGCDVLRETNSRRVLYRTLEERNAQVSAASLHAWDGHALGDSTMRGGCMGHNLLRFYVHANGCMALPMCPDVPG